MGRGTAFDLLGVIESAWRIDLDDAGWLRAIAEAARPALDGGQGVMAYTFDVREVEGPPRVGAVGSSGVDAEQLRHAQRFAAASDRRMVDLQYRCGRVCTTLSGLFGAGGPDRPPLAALELPPGLRDAIGVVGNDGTDQGVVLTAGQTQVRSLDPAFRHRWSRVAAHLAAAARVRRAAARAASEVDSEGAGVGEAVLSADGRLSRAEGDARSWQSGEALRLAARALDRARGRLRHHDPDGALELWTSLVSGRWSLVDHYDAHGCRFLVAHRNEPRVPGDPALTERERQVAALAALGHSSRLIAYELGLGAPTVAAHLRRILAKLRLERREELAPLLSGGRLRAPAA